MNKALKISLAISGIALLMIGIGLFYKDQINLNTTSEYINYKYIGTENDNYLAISDGKKFGYIDTDLNQIIELKYPIIDSMKLEEGKIDLSSFTSVDGLFPYTTNENKIGLVDKNGKVVLKAKYDLVNVINKNFIIVIEDGEYYFSDSKGNNILGSTFQDIAQIDDVSDCYLVYKNNKVGLINSDGTLLLDYNYDKIDVIKDSNSSNIVINATISETKEIYLYNIKTKELNTLSNLFNMNPIYFVDGNIYLVDSTGKYNIYTISNSNLKVLNNNYISIRPFYEGLAQAINNEILVGYIDINENVVIPYQYTFDISTDFDINNLAVVGKNNLVGVINTNNEEVIPIKYTYINIIDDNHFIVLDQNNKSYIIDKNEKKLTKEDYDSIEKTEVSDVFLVSKTSKNNTVYGIIDSRGKVIVDVDYEDIQITTNCFILEKGENEYYIEKR